MLIPITDPAIARNRISKAPTPFELKCLRLGQAKYYRGRLIPIMSGGGFPGGGIGGTGSTGSFWVFDLVGSYGLNLTNSAATNYGIINNLLTLANNAAQPGGANPTQFRSVFYIKGATDIYPTSKITFPMIPISFVGDGPTDSILGTTDGTIVLDNQTIDTSSSSSPFIAGFSGDGRASFVVQLGDYGILTGRSGLVVGGCRTFYLAADYYGDFRAPGAPAGDSTDGLVVMAGRY